MACINPITVSFKRHNSKNKENIQVSCGHCLNCMIKKESQLEFLGKKELIEQYKKGNASSFVTLTYDDNHLPFNEYGFMTLKRKDLQLFIKNMRRQMQYYNCKKQFKYIYCGEYGNPRPHYHIVFFGLSDNEVQLFTKKLWKYGICDIGPLANGGIRYVLKYMEKSLVDSDIKLQNEKLGIQNPFIYHSIGIGKEWIIKNLWKIVENEFTFNINGKINLFPKYVLRFVSNHTGFDYIPYVKKYLSQEFKKVKKEYKYFDNWQLEESIARYKTNVIVARQKGKPINDITTSKKWIKPYHYLDRPIPNIENLVNKALIKL